MNTRILMGASAAFYGIIGISLTFLPEEISWYWNREADIISIIILQLLGAAYIGFAMLNWMTKDNLVGGIYSKPLVVGNLVLFLVSTFALIKIIGITEIHFEIILALSIIYAVFTICFGFIMMTNPGRVKA